MNNKKTLNYSNLLEMSKKLCKLFYVTETKMFGPMIKTRQDEKNMIYSILKTSLNENKYKYDLTELQEAVNLSVDEAAVIKRYSTIPPKIK